MILHRVLPKEVYEVWPDISEWVEDACSKSNGRYTGEYIRQVARQGLWQLWVVYDDEKPVFVGGSEIVIYPSGKKFFNIRFGTGNGRGEWEHLIDDALRWGRAQGCEGSEGVFRVGWRRVLKDWDHTHEWLERTNEGL